MGARFTRREWLAGVTAAAGSAALSPGLRAWPSSALPTGIADTVPPLREPFPTNDVRLSAGMFQQATKANRAYLISLPNDRLMHMFRVTAGLPSSAEPLGGWEEPKSELRGHFAGGHILTACALQYASAGDDEMKAKGNALVAELARCQQALGAGGYLGAYPTEFYDRLREGKKVWAPFYTYHKILAGHLDMYTLCGNEQALATAEKMAGWADAYLKPLGDEQWAKMQMVEHGGMNEALFNLYAITGKQQYLDLARRFDHKRFFDPLAEHRDVLKGLHANTNIPKVIGAARGYEVTGDARYRDIAEFFWKQVTDLRTYCTGGTSNDEEWREDPGKLARQLGPAAEECCCSYNMLKLTRHVYRWTGANETMDYYERTLFNTRLGTQDAAGLKMYYLSLMPGLWKTFGTPYGAFWCCTGTGAEEFAKLADTIYWRDTQGGVYVNLFISSEARWPDKGITVQQETRFPEEEGTTITIRRKAPATAESPIHVRIPGWTRGASVTVNGAAQQLPPAPGAYATLTRAWKDGDKIQVKLPMSLRTESAPDDPAVQAVMYGPLALAGRLGREGLTRDLMYGPLAPDEAKQITVAPLAVSKGMAADCVERVKGETLAFQTVGQAQSTRLSPLYQVMDERYTVYWKAAK